MVRNHLIVAMIAFLGMSFSSCGQDSKEKKTEAAAVASVPGEVKETADYFILVPEKWEFVDFGNAAVQTYTPSGSYAVEVKREGLNMTESDVESTLESLRKTYDGTALEKTDLLGLSFWKTTYNVQSMHQTKYTALKNGQKISITLSGADHETDPTIQAVFASIKLK